MSKQLSDGKGWNIGSKAVKEKLRKGREDGNKPSYSALSIAVQPSHLRSSASPLTSTSDNRGIPTNSIRDRVRFLVFASWWTVFFAAGYLAVFFLAASSFIASIASHGAWIALT